jgi:hypothetical protein
MEVHMTARQRAIVAELLADESVERLGACSIAAEDEYVIVRFARDVICVNEMGAVS